MLSYYRHPTQKNKKKEFQYKNRQKWATKKPYVPPLKNQALENIWLNLEKFRKPVVASPLVVYDADNQLF